MSIIHPSRRRDAVHITVCSPSRRRDGWIMDIYFRRGGATQCTLQCALRRGGATQWTSQCPLFASARRRLIERGVGGKGQRRGSCRQIKKKAARPASTRVYGKNHPLAGQNHRSGDRKLSRKGHVWKVDGAFPPPIGETRFYLVERINCNTLALHVCDGMS